MRVNGRYSMDRGAKKTRALQTTPLKCWYCTDIMIMMSRSDTKGGEGKRWQSWRWARGIQGGNEEAWERTERDANREQWRSERQQEEVWRWTRWRNPLSHTLTMLAHTQTHKHLWACSKCPLVWLREEMKGEENWGGSEALSLKLWSRTWNCSCMLQSILLSIPLSVSRLSAPFFQWKRKAGDEMENKINEIKLYM